MWKTLFNDRQLLGTIFLGLGVAYFTWFYGAVWIFSQFKALLSFKNVLMVVFVVTLPLLFSNTALSYDVFNYAFNAKMVVFYEQNPHIKTALDFPQDDWLRFMHNTHTPAPYGYGWTYLSIIPYVVAGGSFTKTWFLFRIFNLIAFGVLLFGMNWLLKLKNKVATADGLLPILLLYLHPLFLIEIISSSHNDLWMLVPVVWSMAVLTFLPKKISVKFVVLALFSVVLLCFSIWVKLATIVLIPLWIVLFGLTILNGSKFQVTEKLHAFIISHWAVFSSLLLFVPLLTERSKYFLPWYGIWSLVWIPFFPMRSMLARIWASFVLATTTSAFFRYLPYLWTGSYEGATTQWQLIITWGGASILFPIVYYYLTSIFSDTKKNRLK